MLVNNAGVAHYMPFTELPANKAHARRVRRPRQAPGLGVQDDPLVILEGQVFELRASGGQVHVIQRNAPRDTPAPPDPHENWGRRC